jgi:hypothetical protein
MSDGMPRWVESFPGAVTISAADGTILYLNDKASATFAKQGGREALVGADLMACHGEASRAIIRALGEAAAAPGRGGAPGSRPATNAYTITKGGVHKFIYQAPWYEDGVFAGLVELSMEIPGLGAPELPHFERG